MSDAQLNAQAPLVGTFSYTIDGAPLAAADKLVPGTGQHTLSAQFTPSNAALEPASLSVPLTVQPAPLTVTSNATVPFDGDIAHLPPTFTGLVNGDTDAVVRGGRCTWHSPTGSDFDFVIAGSMQPGDYPLTCAGFSADNYAITAIPGTLTITGLQVVVSPNAKTMRYGTRSSPVSGWATPCGTAWTGCSRPHAG